jgi:hypothetical protein
VASIYASAEGFSTLFCPSIVEPGRFCLAPTEKNLTEKVDVAVVLAYKIKLDDMGFRCSNSVAILAGLIGGNACVLLAPAACAGDRIDFSAPAIPLGVPRQEVEVKEPARMIGPAGVADGFMNVTEMAVPSQYYLVKPKSKEKDAWGLDPLLGNDPYRLDTDDLFSTRPDSTRATNGNRLNMRPGSNPNGPGNMPQQKNNAGPDGGQNDSRFGPQNGLDRNDSRFGAKNELGRDNSRFDDRNGPDRDKSRFDEKDGSDRDSAGFDEKNRVDGDHAKIGAKNALAGDYSNYSAQNGLDKDNARPIDRLGRGFSSPADGSLWAKDFARDAAASDRFGGDRFGSMRLMPSMNDARPFSGGAFEQRMSNPALGQDPAQAAAPPSYPGFGSVDDGQGRQFDSSPGAGQESLRAWEPSVGPVLSPRNFSNPDENNNSRFVAPSRPVILSMPQRPGDPH